MKTSVAAAVVVGLGGWFAEPYAQDWWLARQVCGGAPPADAVQRLMPDEAHLAEAEARHVDGLGSYTCELRVEGDDGSTNGFLEFSAYTQRDDQDREFRRLFPSHSFPAHTPLPKGMPGFVDDRFGDIWLLLPCPDLGKGAAGRPRTMLVATELSYAAKAEAGAQDAYEIAAAFADAASEELGCGAEPVDVPEGNQGLLSPEEDGADTVPLRQVKGAACGWLAHAGLPQDTEWRVEVLTNGSMPVSRCDVLAHAGQDEEQRLTFAGWYGDWSARVVTSDGRPRSMTATARCQGQAAAYRMRADDQVSGVDDTMKRRLFETFVRGEVRRHDCSELRFTP